MANATYFSPKIFRCRAGPDFDWLRTGHPGCTRSSNTYGSTPDLDLVRDFDCVFSLFSLFFFALKKLVVKVSPNCPAWVEVLCRLSVGWKIQCSAPPYEYLLLAANVSGIVEADTVGSTKHLDGKYSSIDDALRVQPCIAGWLCFAQFTECDAGTVIH